MERAEANESTRLLASSEIDVHPGSSTSRRPDVGATVPSARRTILVVAVVQVILNVGSYVSFAAQLAILQNIICDKYYEEARPPLEVDERCMVDFVQSEVAFVNGWKDVFEMLPAIVLAVPYGALADRIGRKKVFLLAVIGIAMNDLWIRIVFWFHDTIPVRAVWLGGLWQIIGAGAASLSSISHVMVADVCPSDQRTTAFSQLQSATMIAQFLFVPIGGTLVSVDPWIPMMISSAVTVLGFLGALIFLPETLPSTGSRILNKPDLQVRHDISGGDTQDEAACEHYLPHGRWQSFRFGLVRTIQWVRENARLVCILTCFFFCSLGQQAGGSLLLQYASKRLGWSLGKSSYLLSLGAAINLVVHAIGIPALSIFLIKRLNLHEIAKDKRIAQVSGLFLVLGSGIAFAAGSPAFLVFGQVLTSMGLAFAVPARSIVTSMFAQKHLAALYTTISVLSYAGMLTGGPVLASAFHWGLSIGGLWLGMPFLVASVCFAVALLAISSVSITANYSSVPGEEIRGGAEPIEP